MNLWKLKSGYQVYFNEIIQGKTNKTPKFKGWNKEPLTFKVNQYGETQRKSTQGTGIKSSKPTYATSLSS